MESFVYRGYMQGNSKEEAMAYIAGILDGEGAIFISRDLFSKKNPVHRVGIRIGMIERAALQFIYDKINLGSLIKEKSYKNQRPIHRWLLTSYDEIKEFLNLMLPYLIVKKEQALHALDFIENCRGNRGHWMTQDLIQKRENYWIKMRELNGHASPATTERSGKRGRSKSIRLEATV